MRRTWQIAAKELLENRRDGLAALFTIILPVVFTIFLGLLILHRRSEAKNAVTVGGALRSFLETTSLLGFGGVLGALWFRLRRPVWGGQTSLYLWPMVAVYG